MMPLIVRIMLISVVLFSCSTGETEKRLAQKRQAAEDQDRLNQYQTILVELGESNATTCLFDTLSYSYTIEYEHLLGTNVMIEEFCINDIVKQDTIIFAYIKVGNQWSGFGKNNPLIKLELDMNGFKELIKIKTNPFHTTNKLPMVIRLESVQKMQYYSEWTTLDGKESLLRQFSMNTEFLCTAKLLEVADHTHATQGY